MKKALSLLCVMVLLFSASCSVSPNQPGTTASETQTGKNTAASVTAVFNPDIRVTSLSINGQEISGFECLDKADIVVYNMTDSEDKLVINAKSDIEGTTFTYDNDISDFKLGENIVLITVTAPDKSQRQITLIVVKYDENGQIAYRLYQKARDLYDMNRYFEFDDTRKYKPDDVNELTLIKNYEKVMAENFTELGAYRFGVTNMITKHDGAIYGPNREYHDTSFNGAVLSEKSISENRMVYMAKEYYSRSDDSGQVVNQEGEHCFSIEKENGVWLIDEWY